MSLSLVDTDQEAFETLLKEIKRDECILFVGAGVSREVGLPSGSSLAATLARDSGYSSSGSLALSQVAQHYETKYGRKRLIERIRRLLHRTVKDDGRSSYDLIASTQYLNKMVITTNWDDLLEQAFRCKGLAPASIRYDEQVYLLGQVPAVVKLHGDLDGKIEELVLTRDDYARAYERVTQPGGLFSLVGTWLATKTFIFVGYSLDDPDFQFLYDKVGRAVGAGAREHYAVMPAAKAETRDYWRSRRITIIDTKANEFFEEVFIRTCQFVNREHELKLVWPRAIRPCVELHGFAGCGKTELLQELIDRYETTGNWRIVSLRFDQDSTLAEPFDLMSEIAEQSALSPPDKRQLTDKARIAIAKEKGISVQEVALSEAAKHVNNIAVTELCDSVESERLMILVDGSEWLPKDLARWIEEVLVPTIEMKVRNPQEQMCLVFAGRYPLAWTNPHLKGTLLHVHQLTAFEEGAVGDKLDRFAALRIRAPLPSDKRARLISEVLDITSGHPKCIHSLLEELAESKFELPPDFFSVNRLVLFERHVEPALGEILREIPEPLQRTFRQLCIFRRLMPDTLDELTARRQINADARGSLWLLGELRTKTRMIGSRPDPFYVIDPVVRRMLTLQMRLRFPGKYQKMNKLAIKMYENWIKGFDITGIAKPFPAVGDVQVACFVEVLFHHVQQLNDQGQTGPAAAQAIGRTMRRFLVPKMLRPTQGPPDIHRQVETLLSRLEQDHELLKETSRLIPTNGYHALLEPVRAFLVTL